MSFLTVLRTAFGLNNPVNRKTYILYGFPLMAIKYAVEVFASRIIFHRWEFDLMVTSRIGFFNPPSDFHPDLALFFILWSLPFLWIGSGMSVRRAADAGLSPWWAILFFVPFVNLGLITVLSALPSATPGAWKSQPQHLSRLVWTTALKAIGASLVIGVLLIVVDIYHFENYGWSLFIGIPFVMGLMIGVFINKKERKSAGTTFLVTLLTLVILAGVLLLFAMEGALCILMAFPPAFVLSTGGCLFGRAIILQYHPKKTTLPSLALLVLLIPVSSFVEQKWSPLPVHEAVSSVSVNAPIEVVWAHVVSFSRIPEPTEWMFRSGIAYPIEAVIDGEGVGAIRECRFSTGSFVEPITRWDKPTRLSFDVAFQPKPMKELSPYDQISAPHLDDFFSSKKGEFRLIDLGNGRTRLEGSTWYTLDIRPEPYWRLYAEKIVHKIHGRVLEHIKKEAEENTASR